MQKGLHICSRGFNVIYAAGALLRIYGSGCMYAAGASYMQQGLHLCRSVGPSFLSEMHWLKAIG